MPEKDLESILVLCFELFISGLLTDIWQCHKSEHYSRCKCGLSAKSNINISVVLMWYFTIFGFSVDSQLGDWFISLLFHVYYQCGSWQEGKRSRNLLLLFVFTIKELIFMMSFAYRSKETDWQPYFTTRLVDDFGTHLRVFRKAQQRIAEKGNQMKGNGKYFFIWVWIGWYLMCVRYN